MSSELKKTDIESVSSLSAKYTEALQRIGERREQWKAGVRDQLHAILENLRLTTGLSELHTQKLTSYQNLETVNIGFNDAPSGIVLTDGATTTPATKHGGSLCFSQAYNGKIVVYILYPYVDGYVEPLENKLFDVHEPADLNADIVVGYFEKFIREMTDWETMDKNPIGFKVR